MVHRHVPTCILATLLVWWLHCTVFATEPFSNTFVVKENGEWCCPHQFTCDLVVVDRDEAKTTTIPLTALFSEHDYARYVSESTAGPLWGAASLYYIFELNGSSYFTMCQPGGSRLLVNLSTGVVGESMIGNDDLAALDRQEIEAMLDEAIRALKTDVGFDEQKLHGALLMAAHYKMTELIPQIGTVEEQGWHGALAFVGDYSYGVGMQPEITARTYNVNHDRRFAELALRRLGHTPRGFGQLKFGTSTDRVSIETRAERIQQLRAGQRSGQIFELLGAPDYMLSAIEPAPQEPLAYRTRTWVDAWRYDLGGDLDYSLLVIWTDDGRIKTVQRIAPGLWNTEGVFQDHAHVFAANGEFNGIHLYGERFIGENRTILE